jgi:mannose-6-phosphate isomerase-like protein (cupin superfamily)
VTGGRGSFTAGGRTVEAVPGMTLFVPAGKDHRFHLALLVFFAPAYSGQA